MNTRVERLSPKTIVGLCTRTSNSDPDMENRIGALWQKLLAEKLLEKISNRCNQHAIGLYSDYADDKNGAYDVTIGCEVNQIESLPASFHVKTIPAGNYAVFVTHGDAHQAVSALWHKVWNLPLDRTYTGDFEEYIPSADGQLQEIRLYIAVK